jgi:hypothetical protein
LRYFFICYFSTRILYHQSISQLPRVPLRSKIWVSQIGKTNMPDRYNTV